MELKAWLLWSYATAAIVRFDDDSKAVSNQPLVPLLDVPRLLDDPQTIPGAPRRYFVADQYFELCINLQPVPRTHPYDDIYLNVVTKHQWVSCHHIGDQSLIVLVTEPSLHTQDRTLTSPYPLAIERRTNAYQAHSYIPSILVGFELRNLWTSLSLAQRLVLNGPISHCWTQNELPSAVLQPIFILLINPQGRANHMQGNITIYNRKRSGLTEDPFPAYDTQPRWTHLSVTQQSEMNAAFYAAWTFALL